jgi:hypothetical protein
MVRTAGLAVGTQFDDCVFPVDQRIGEDLEAGVHRDIEPVAAAAGGAPELGAGGRQVEIGELESFNTIEIDIGEPAGALAEDDADIVVVAEVLRRVGGDIPTFEDRTLLFGRNRDDAPTAVLIFLHGVDGRH